MLDYDDIVGTDVRCLDEPDYGSRIISYNSSDDSYSVNTIYWSDGASVGDKFFYNRIPRVELFSNYDISSPRLTDCQ